MDTESTLRAKYEALAPVLNERTRRLWAASEAQALGHGGIAVVARATGLSRTRIARGCKNRPPLTASQRPPAVNVAPNPSGLADVPDFGRSVAEWEAAGDCYALETLDANLQDVVEGFAAAYNRAAAMDPLDHAAEVLTAALLIEISDPDSRPEPGTASVATLTKHELAHHLALYKAAQAAVRSAWWRTTCADP